MRISVTLVEVQNREGGHKRRGTSEIHKGTGKKGRGGLARRRVNGHEQCKMYVCGTVTTNSVSLYNLYDKM